MGVGVGSAAGLFDKGGGEAGKKAAGAVLELQGRVVGELRKRAGQPATSVELASALGADPETIFLILHHLAANPGRGVRAEGADPATSRFFAA